jgi:hypothetical protein
MAMLLSLQEFPNNKYPGSFFSFGYLGKSNFFASFIFLVIF